MDELERLRKELDEVYEMALAAKNNIETHEQVCAVRYGAIDQGLETLNAKISGGTYALLGALFAIVGVLVFYMLTHNMPAP